MKSFSEVTNNNNYLKKEATYLKERVMDMWKCLKGGKEREDNLTRLQSQGGII